MAGHEWPTRHDRGGGADTQHIQPLLYKVHEFLSQVDEPYASSWGQETTQGGLSGLLIILAEWCFFMILFLLNSVIIWTTLPLFESDSQRVTQNWGETADSGPTIGLKNKNCSLGISILNKMPISTSNNQQQWAISSVGVSQHQVLFYKRDASYKSNHPEDKLSIADQSG